ncbi:MAG: NAD(P)-binding protein, partial [Thermoleophilaceae bacterium]
MPRKQKVAVLGGGVGGIVAAYELSSTPELREQYEVTVYQFGWRLGGKCASGRNREYGQRIEEHGLHVWFGFYDNAFRVMREVYGELGRDADAPLATWEDAFKPCDEIVLYEGFRDRWRGWSFDVPRNPLTPGDADPFPDFWEIAEEMLDYLLGRWEDVKQNSDHVQRETHRHGLLPFDADRLALDVLARLLRRGVHPEQALFAARKLIGEPAHRSLLWAAIDDFKRWLWRHIVEPNVEDDDLRFFFTMFDAGTT